MEAGFRVAGGWSNTPPRGARLTEIGTDGTWRPDVTPRVADHLVTGHAAFVALSSLCPPHLDGPDRLVAEVHDAAFAFVLAE